MLAMRLLRSLGCKWWSLLCLIIVLQMGLCVMRYVHIGYVLLMLMLLCILPLQRYLKERESDEALFCIRIDSGSESGMKYMSNFFMNCFFF